MQGFSYGGHEAVDLGGVIGAPIYAAGGGTVVFAGRNSTGYGNLVVIAHGSVFSLYGHLNSVGVSCGQSVTAGQQIGTLGNTGNSTGPHLHFELRSGNWGAINPFDYQGSKLSETIWPVIGHTWAVEHLDRAIRHGRTRHAYLITGPSRIGKTTLARAFAAAVNCKEPNAPCGTCRPCKLILKNGHPDVTVVEAEGSTLKIDQVRALQQTLALRPLEARYRVAICGALMKRIPPPPMPC